MNRLMVAAMAAIAMCSGAAFAEPSRCTLGEAKFMSWAPRERPWTLKDGLLHLDAKPGEATTFAFNRNYYWGWFILDKVAFAIAE